MGFFNKHDKGKHSPDSPAEGASEETQALETTSADATEALPSQAQGLADSQPTAEETAVMAAVPGMPGYTPPDEALSGLDVDTAGYPLNAPAAEGGSYVSAGFGEVPSKRRFRGLKAFLITFVILAVILAGVYVGVAMMFQTQFMPNSRIGDMDISMKHDDEVAEMLKDIPQGYQIDVVGGKFALRMTGQEIGMSIDTDQIIAQMHADQNAWYWPWYVLEPKHDETPFLKTTFDEGACDKLVKSAVGTFNKKATAPVDASIIFDEKTQTFTVKPEEIGTQLDVKAVQGVVKQAATDMEPKLELTDEQLKQPSLLSTDEKLNESAKMATGLVSAHLNLMINGKTVDEIGSEVLSGFVNINDKFDVSLNEDELAAWVAQLAASYDTIGSERTYTRADGKVITVRGGSYGWEIDEDTLRASIMDAIKAGKQADIEIPCVDSANYYAGHGERDWGNRYIDVDLSEQHARFYGDDGSIIWEADIISGSPDAEHATPQGVWYVIMKQSPSKLIGYLPDGKTKDYEVEVKYWMPFKGNSVGFHDANWQPSFGGSMYAQGYGSHGCVNLSTDSAKKLYSVIEPNDVVVVHE